MWPVEIYIFIFFSFLLAGTVKGLIGLGFPTIILAMLSLTIGMHEAMAVMLLPCFLTNIWQAVSGGFFTTILRRIWPLLCTAVVTIWITTAFIADIKTEVLSSFLGIVVVVYASIGLSSPGGLSVGKWEVWMTPVVGLINGIITGLTGTFVVPGVLYLQSLKLHSDILVQAMGVLFVVSTAALGFGLFSHNLLGRHYLFLSAAALLPSFAGMSAGKIFRKQLSENKFQSLFYYGLLVLGVYILGRNLI